MITIPGYKVIKIIGQGGMASVYLATQESVGRDVAIKVMSPALSSDPSFSERFVKEARMANLTHPHIISIFDAGEIDGQNYIIMEYANGGNLDTAIKKGLTLHRVIEIISEIANALHYSATKGFIHRDVKPENILIREDGSAILVDFGIAKAISAGTKLTMVGSTIGSPNYMSPEQARGLPLDGRSDLYSLGIVLYEALTGTKPYDADDTFVIGLKHINEPVPTLPNEFQPFQATLNKLLAKVPDERFNNGHELVESLKNIPIHLGRKNAFAGSAQNSEQTAVSASTFQQQETVETLIGGEVTVADDSTRTLSYSDKTRIQTKANSPTNDNTVVKQNLRQPEKKQTTKSNTGLLFTLLFTFSAVAGGGVWYWQAQTDASIDATTKIEDIPPALSSTIEPKVEEKSQQDIIAQLLEDASQAMERKRFTTPDENNAFYFYEQVLSLDQGNEKAIVGIKKLADKYITLANKQLNKKAYESALRFIDKGLFVDPKDSELITLRDKIYTRQQKEKEQQLALFKDHKTVLKQDKSINSLIGKHIGANSDNNFWFARQDLVNQIYNQILSQCNSTNKAFIHPDCEQSYNRFIKQWPLPLIATVYSEKVNENETTAKIEFSKNNVKKRYQALLDHYRLEYKKGINSAFSNKEQLIVLANYDLHTSLAPLFGIKTNKKVRETLRTAIKKYRTKRPVKEIDNLINIVKKIALNKKIAIKPFIGKNSYEITPFALSLHNNISDSLDVTNIENSEYTLLGEYEITRSGNYNLDLWVFDNESKIIDILALTLDSKIAKNSRYTPHLYNTTIFPKNRLEKAYGFPTELSIGKQTSNALLQVGENIDLKVKLDNIGFYFIAVHVKRENDAFSYLLPLHNAEIPFVQVTTRKNANKLITLGSFTITPPVGVEVLQLIASSVNLAKYLPSYEWDVAKKQFIITGSVGNIEKGIKAVRDKANTISENSQKKGTLWQEKLLFTSILELQ